MLIPNRFRTDANFMYRYLAAIAKGRLSWLVPAPGGGGDRDPDRDREGAGGKLSPGSPMGLGLGPGPGPRGWRRLTSSPGLSSIASPPAPASGELQPLSPSAVLVQQPQPRATPPVVRRRSVGGAGAGGLGLGLGPYGEDASPLAPRSTSGPSLSAGLAGAGCSPRPLLRSAGELSRSLELGRDGPRPLAPSPVLGPRPSAGGASGPGAGSVRVVMVYGPGGGTGPGPGPGTPGPPLFPTGSDRVRAGGYASAEDRELYSLQKGVRAVILLQAVVAWTSCLVFAVALSVARWGPASHIWPFDPSVFPAEDCTLALQFAGITAGVHAAVVAALAAAGAAFPSLRERLAFGPAWRLLRERAALLCCLFAACGAMACLSLFRYANIFYYVFPQAYARSDPGM
eukprot:tig00021728_g23305.t1